MPSGNGSIWLHVDGVILPGLGVHVSLEMGTVLTGLACRGRLVKDRVTSKPKLTCRNWYVPVVGVITEAEG